MAALEAFETTTGNGACAVNRAAVGNYHKYRHKEINAIIVLITIERADSHQKVFLITVYY